MSRRPDAHRRRVRGVTMVDVILAVTLFTMLLGSVGLVSRTSERVFQRDATAGAVELRSGAALDAIQRELEPLARASLTPDPLAGVGASEVFYRHAEDFDGNDVVLGEQRSLRFELDPGETADGTDEDGDGLVDEGQVVLVERVGLATERARVLTRDVAALAEGEAANGIDDNGNGLVDEPGFVIERRGGALDVRLTLARATSDGREVVTRAARTSVAMRN